MRGNDATAPLSAEAPGGTGSRGGEGIDASAGTAIGLPSTSISPISIVVATAGRPRLLNDCLASLIAQEFPDDLCEIVVVDDGDGEAAAVVERLRQGGGKRIVHVEHRKHDVNAARNVGIRSARFDVVCLVDDDVVAPPGWLRSLAEGIQRHPEAQCFAGGVQPVFETQAPRSCGCALPGSHLDLGPEERETRAAWGCNMAMRTSAFDLVGPLRPGMEIETEMEWILRLRASGGRIVWIPDAWVWHRRLESDLRTWKILHQQFRRGRLRVELGSGVTFGSVTRGWARSLLHAARRGCANGLFRAARYAGMAVALLGGRRAIRSSHARAARRANRDRLSVD